MRPTTVFVYWVIADGRPSLRGVRLILYLNNIVPEDTILDGRSLPNVAMPNRNGFTSPDPRPEVP
jgi:hypothetical protein